MFEVGLIPFRRTNRLKPIIKDDMILRGDVPAGEVQNEWD
jgi:hypothetical protein